jgi:hypothetical protein
MKKFIIIFLLLGAFFLTYSQTDNKELNAKIDQIESRINGVKKNIPAGQEKKYNASLSDVENRKNQLKMLLKTPPEKRDAKWNTQWDENYNRATAKLSSIEGK